MENQAVRIQALKMARELNPNQITQNQQLGYGSFQTPPSVEKLLKDADEIYNWLIKK